MCVSSYFETSVQIGSRASIWSVLYKPNLMPEIPEGMKEYRGEFTKCSGPTPTSLAVYSICRQRSGDSCDFQGRRVGSDAKVYQLYNTSLNECFVSWVGLDKTGAVLRIISLCLDDHVLCGWLCSCLSVAGRIINCYSWVGTT